jgi:hypothetical protein
MLAHLIVVAVAGSFEMNQIGAAAGSLKLLLLCWSAPLALVKSAFHPGTSHWGYFQGDRSFSVSVFGPAQS